MKQGGNSGKATEERPLHQRSAADRFIIDVSDALKATARSRLLTLPGKPPPKVGRAGLMTTALVSELLGQPSAQQLLGQVRATSSFL